MDKQKKTGNKIKIRNQVKNLLAEIAGVNIKDIKESAKIRDDLGLDSLTSAEILAAIETRMGIVLDEAEALNIETVEDLINLIMSHLEKSK